MDETVDVRAHHVPHATFLVVGEDRGPERLAVTPVGPTVDLALAMPDQMLAVSGLVVDVATVPSHDNAAARVVAVLLVVPDGLGKQLGRSEGLALAKHRLETMQLRFVGRPLPAYDVSEGILAQCGASSGHDGRPSLRLREESGKLVAARLSGRRHRGPKPV